MGETVRVSYTIHKDLKEKIDSFVSTAKHEHNEKTAKILEVLRRKPTASLITLHWELRTKHKINRRPSTLKKMAIEYKIDYIE